MFQEAATGLEPVVAILQIAPLTAWVRRLVTRLGKLLFPICLPPQSHRFSP